MTVADPTYPLYPIACLLAAAMLLLVSLNSFIRQSWNFGVASLCFWLFLELLSLAINSIVWSDNAEIKLYVYCDIVTHLKIIAYVVKPMATLIITRRLYLITDRQSVSLTEKEARHRTLAIEWILGLAIPVLVAGPLYYIVQSLRFKVLEGLGCENETDSSVLSILLIDSWSVVPPLLSVIIYYPRVARLFYRQRRDINNFLQSNGSMTRTNYVRILVLASIDLIVTLPFGIVSIVLFVTGYLSVAPFVFYSGWTVVHTDWAPVSFPYALVVAGGTSAEAQQYFTQWTSPVLAFVIFGLFGVTSEARASYWRVLWTIGRWFGWKPTTRALQGRSTLGDIEFGERTREIEAGSQTGYFKPATRADEHVTGTSSEGERETIELKNMLDVAIVEELRQDTVRGTANATHRELGTTESARAACAV